MSKHLEAYLSGWVLFGDTNQRSSRAELIAALGEAHEDGIICGRVFQEGDLAFNCNDCQSDPTCVMCEDCFKDSEHTGHDVSFHRAGAGYVIYFHVFLVFDTTPR